ncbi:MAG: hypothetical protein ABMA64_08575 [Myxococcota bacterium]
MRATWVFFASGCLDYGVGRDPIVYGESYPAELAGQVQQDAIVQAATPLVDALFVIDNSCSMEEEQAALSANFYQFMAYFDGSGLDFHVGVVSTDLDAPSHQGHLQAAGDVLFIDAHTPEPTEVFAQMAALGTTGSGQERGLGAAYLALEVHRDTFNAGFYRDDASIHTVLISDEQDQTQDTVISESEFVDWYSALKRSSGDRTFSSIVETYGPDAGTVYLDVSRDIGGTTWDIASADWGVVLERLGLVASGLRREFFLSRLPVESTLDVQIERADGSVIAGLTSGRDWTYSASRNSVTLVEIVPEPYATVRLAYAIR